MSDKDRVLDGYCFSDEATYNAAKKDHDVIIYLKNQVDMNDSLQVLRLYQQAISQDLFKTVIGIDFLKKLQNYLLSIDDIDKSKVVEIPSSIASTGTLKDEPTEYDNALLRKENSAYKAREKKLRFTIDRYKNRFQVTLTITFILAVMVGVMFFITLSSKLPTIVNYRTKVINEYSSWEEELNSKEKALEEREQEIIKKEQENNADK